jgi:uncharacterized RDD family membrane protein YckC
MRLGGGVPETETPHGERAGLVTRAAAAALDATILSLAMGAAIWLLEIGAHAARRFAPPIDLPALLLAGAPLLVIAYHTAFWRTSGRTPGQWIMGIRVVALGGGRVSVARCLLRLLGCLLSTLPVYLGFLWILGPQRRGWHDLLAGTEVVYVARQPADSQLHTTHGSGYY